MTVPSSFSYWQGSLPKYVETLELRKENWSTVDLRLFIVNYSSLPNFRYCQRAQVVKGGDQCYLFGIAFDSYVIKRF